MDRVSVINHEHRTELGLSVDEYVVCLEAVKCIDFEIIERAEYVSAKCLIPLGRVINILAHLSSRGIISACSVSEKWIDSYEKYYGVKSV